MPARILITEPIVNEVIQTLQEQYTVDVGERGQFVTDDDLAAVIGRYDALLPMLSNPVTAKVIGEGTNLKIIANHAVGYNNIDMQAARAADIHVANTPGVLTESCADFTMGLLLAVTRKLAPAERYLRKGEFDGWEPLGFLGMELNGRTLGIFGMGRIGTAVARRAQAFGLKIAYHNRNRVAPAREQALGATYLPSLEELARRSDILTLHCPLTPGTRHAVDKNLINLLPDHAVIINTSRGPVIDERALAEALHENRLAGAGLDVFEEEPEVDPRLLEAPNCVLTPHIASATHRTRKAIGMLAAEAIDGILSGKDPATISNLLTG